MFQDDDQIETAIFVQVHDLSSPVHRSSRVSPPAASVMELDESSFDHGKSVDGGVACCRRESDGLVDCQACIEEEHSNFTINLNKEDRELALHMLTIIREAGSNGIARNDLRVSFRSSGQYIVAQPFFFPKRICMLPVNLLILLYAG